ncbi:MAG: hypothetical protein Q8O88_01890 [bacterium]|nr:hypothetical protein [bacterium]
MAKISPDAWTRDPELTSGQKHTYSNLFTDKYNNISTLKKLTNLN